MRSMTEKIIGNLKNNIIWTKILIKMENKG